MWCLFGHGVITIKLKNAFQLNFSQKWPAYLGVALIYLCFDNYLLFKMVAILYMSNWYTSLLNNNDLVLLFPITKRPFTI